MSDAVISSVRFSVANAKRSYMMLMREYMRYKCITSMREVPLGTVNQQERDNIIARFIIAEKTFSSESIQYDPIIPQFNHQPSVSQLRKESNDKLSVTKLGLQSTDSELQAMSDEYVATIHQVADKYMSDGLVSGSASESINSVMVSIIQRAPTHETGMIRQLEEIRSHERSRERSSETHMQHFKYELVVQYDDKKIVAKISESVLASMVSSYHVSSSEDPNWKSMITRDIALVFIRYTALGGFGLQWSVFPELIRDSIRRLTGDYRDEDVIELFASSINHNFPLYGTLFPDVDGLFGGLYSYVGILERTDISPKIVISNPPYIEAIMTDASERILRWLNETPDGIVIAILPYWIDSAGFRLLEDSPYLRRKDEVGDMSSSLEGGRRVPRSAHRSVKFMLSNTG